MMAIIHVSWTPGTVLQMVPVAFAFSNITVMTNSLHIVNASELDNEQTILMPGGTFRKKSASFHGRRKTPLETVSFDKLFMGTDGDDLNVGVTTFNEVYAVGNAVLLRHAGDSDGGLLKIWS